MVTRITGIDKSFIINAIYMEEVPLIIKTNNVINTKITYIDHKTFSFEIDKEHISSFKRGSEIELNFTFQSKDMSFKSNVVSININDKKRTLVLSVSIPEYIISNLLRRYERIVLESNVVNVSVDIEIEKADFFLKKEKFFEYLEDSEDSYAVDAKTVYEKITTFLRENKINFNLVFFSEDKEDSFEETLIKVTQKSLYLPIPKPEEKKEDFISEKDILSSLSSGKESILKFKNKIKTKHLSKLILQDSKGPFKFMAYLPLEIQNFVFGYFLIKGRNIEISEENLKFLLEEIEKLCFEFSKIKQYSKDKYMKYKINDVYIDNISGNGVMLYYFKNSEKFMKLVESLKVNYTFLHDNWSISFYGKVAWRDFSQNDFNFIGVSYIIEEEDEDFYIYLKNIYGEKFARSVFEENTKNKLG